MSNQNEELSVEDVLRSIVEDGYLSETKANRARAALARKSQEPVVKPGWRLVPIDPTFTMAVAGRMEANRHNFGNNQMMAIYKHMVAAAPRAESEASHVQA